MQHYRAVCQTSTLAALEANAKSAEWKEQLRKKRVCLHYCGAMADILHEGPGELVYACESSCQRYPCTQMHAIAGWSTAAAALQWLRAITSLTSLALYSCAIPHSAAATLKAALPRLLTLGLDPPD